MVGLRTIYHMVAPPLWLVRELKRFEYNSVHYVVCFGSLKIVAPSLGTLHAIGFVSS